MNTARNNGLICVSLAAKTARELIDGIRRAKDVADIVELRFDALSRREIDTFLAEMPRIPLPVVFTFRPSEQGGCRPLTREDRLQFWRRALERHPSFVDLEPDIADAVDRKAARLVVSRHDLRPTDDLTAALDQMARDDAILKVAVTVSDAVEAVRVWKLLDDARSLGREAIPIAMGEAGKWTRILGPAHDAAWTYASLDDDSRTAAGQLTAEELLNVYRIRQINRETLVYGVIGDPVGHSLSPYIHNAAFADSGIDAVFVPFQVSDLHAFMNQMVLPKTREVELNLAGFAVTMPHKQAIMRYLDTVDGTASDIGAVNTVSIKDGVLHGHNTDVQGFIAPLKSALGDLTGLRAAVLGAGGAARACVYGLTREGADAAFFARDSAKAACAASRFGVDVEPISTVRSAISNYDVLVNATPLGMGGDDPGPLTANELKGVKLVFDLVTSATDTPLVREAKLAGVATIGGIDMLIEQAVKQFEAWTGRAAPAEVMRAAAFARSRKMR